MSQEWVDAIRTGFEAFVRGDVESLSSMATPDVVLVQPREVPDAKTYEGPEAFAQAMEDWPRQWDDFRMELIEVIDLGDEVAINLTRHTGRGRESGIEMNFDVFNVFWGRDGKLARMEMYFDREQALNAARGRPAA
jgi:ketosteroid isomerase-like protein